MSSRIPSAKVTGTSRPCSSLMRSARTDAEFRQNFGAVPRALGGAASNSLGCKRLGFVVGQGVTLGRRRA